MTSKVGIKMAVNEYNTYKKDAFLSKEEELELGRIIQAHYKAKEELASNPHMESSHKKELEEKVKHGESAIDKMVNANLGLVYSRARTFKSSFPAAPPLPDLIQEGMVGLMKAIQKYDPERDNKFSTVAYYWIAQSVSRGTNKTGRLVRLPENRITDYGKISKLLQDLDTENMTNEEVDQYIMSEVGIQKKDLMNIRAATATPASLNKVVGDGDGDKELIDFVGNDHMASSSESIVMKEEMLKVLYSSIDKLSDIKQDIIYSTVNIDEERYMTPTQVREKYDIKPFKYKKLQGEAYREISRILSNNGFQFDDFINN